MYFTNKYKRKTSSFLEKKIYKKFNLSNHDSEDNILKISLLYSKRHSKLVRYYLINKPCIFVKNYGRYPKVFTLRVHVFY